MIYIDFALLSYAHKIRSFQEIGMLGWGEVRGKSLAFSLTQAK